MEIRSISVSLLLGLWVGRGLSLDVDLTSADSVKSAAQKIASNLMTYYKGNELGEIPGILPGPPPIGDYYWWEGGALWGTMIDYWHYTKDTAYNDLTHDALVFQANMPTNNFLTPNWTVSMGNDDQGFWGMSAMLAAETKFENPSSDVQWPEMVDAVFESQAVRWDEKTCQGGLRWQIPPSNVGYDYKNTMSNAVFFNLGARLARYTSNGTYASWAEKAWNWTQSIGFIADDWNVFDGAGTEDDCASIHKTQFSYNAAALIQGAGFMYNYTKGADVWRNRLVGLTNRTLEVFFPQGVAVEVSCELEDQNTCKTDMLAFKGFLHRWLAQTAEIAPFLSSQIMPVLKTSAKGAMSACKADGACGFRWTTGDFDEMTGAGQQMNALGALMSVLGDLQAAESPSTGTQQTSGSPTLPAATDKATDPSKNGSARAQADFTARITVVFLLLLGFMSLI